MIEVSLDVFFLTPLVITLCSLLGAWLYYDIRHAYPPKKRVKSQIYHCTQCDRVYLDQREVPAAECPRCRHMNEALKEYD